MRKVVKLFWQLAILPILYIPYRILNETVLINILGCSCSTDDICRGVIDANDFTKLFFSIVVIVIIVISVYKVKSISKISSKVIYIMCITCISTAIGNILYQSMLLK
ncbi:hypothetical protein KQI30_02885 [Clostridium bornimense]|uniref:hypothetical protein n=1 Tax=Clostridium bornimense TaxID=1216932 RepID=UPI001C125110|nr:hypothetical protein [Clostridium bornimense]MBU5315222.1 hypothetical protein [Clostridium bornimense]